MPDFGGTDLDDFRSEASAWLAANFPVSLRGKQPAEGPEERTGDREIWRIHPYEHSLVAWRLQDDASYTETAHQSGVVPVLSLPGVSIRLESLFS